MIELRACRDCSVSPGEEHLLGCDNERCRLCGGQAISCNCARELGEDEDGDATEEAWEKYDAEVNRLGGRLLWSGEFPGCDDARRLDLWCKWVDGRGWVECKKDDVGAREDLNRLNDFYCRWDAVAGRWEKR